MSLFNKTNYGKVKKRATLISKVYNIFDHLLNGIKTSRDYVNPNIMVATHNMATKSVNKEIKDS